MDPLEAFSDSPHPGQEKQIMAAWDRLLRGAELPPNVIRGVIEQSWSRCHSAGIDPGRSRAQEPATESNLRTLQQRHHDLIDASVPIMKQAHGLLSDSGTMMILTDPTGVILETAGDQGTLEAAQDVRLVAGANWDELACGTNAIGTALSIGEPVQVHAAEHFCAGIKPWTCSATVVRDPARGEVIGVVDVSGLSRTFHRDFLALAVMTAGRSAALSATDGAATVLARDGHATPLEALVGRIAVLRSQGTSSQYRHRRRSLARGHGHQTGLRGRRRQCVQRGSPDASWQRDAP